MPATPTISKEEIENVIHYVFLPPKVPQAAEEDDEIVFSNELTLLKMVGDALAFFSAHVPPDEAPAVEKAHQAVLQLYDLKDLSPGKLQEAFRNLYKDGGYLPIHVHAQNAAILVSRESKAIIFEFFELAPTNQAVMSTEGRLRRRFPASAMSLPLSVFCDDDIHAALAAAINTMDRQQVAEMKPRARKSGHDQIEERDTNDPSIVTDFLATVLRAKGELVQVPVLTKNTREQINWQNARLPWRRSPSWLLTRVIIQTILSRHHDDTLYKQFMVFFMAQVLAAALPRSLAREVIYCMVAKISGRLQKMERDASRSWLQSVEEIVAAAVLSIEQSWEATIQKADPSQDMKFVSSKSLDRDARIKLPALDEFIETLGLRQSSVQVGFFTPTWSLPEWTSSGLPLTAFSQAGDGAVVELFAFEEWVATYLDTWILVNLSKETTPAALFELMKAYHSSALNNYRCSPSAISLMVLTTLELWVACDRSVCKTHPLLLKYTHQIPFDLFQSLILPFKSQMERLHRVETYMQDRHSAALRQATPSIFHSFGQPKSFGVKFYLSSTHHQSLKTAIEIQAQRERQAKITEFHQKRAQYSNLTQQSKQRSCEYYTGYNRRTGVAFTRHDRNCRKCSLQRQAEAISITVHEWPLPDATNLAQNVVFELHVPHAFGIWRDATAFAIINVLRFQVPHSAEAAPVEYLQRYLASDFTSSSSSCRFTLASTTKSNQRTHRKMQALQTVSVDDILLKNGLHYRYFDRIASEWVASFTETRTLSTECTYQLSKSYSSMQQFIFRSHQNPNGKTANHAISEQSECPEHLSLEEFKALAVLPCGYRIQWHNILAQLHMPIINFTNSDVVLILLQVSQQAGPPSKGGIHRAGHWPLNDEAFALAFLEGLSASLERTSENWEAYHALKCLVVLASRLLSLFPTAAVASECLKFLAACRQVAMHWLGLLQDRVKSSESGELRTALLSNLLSIAQICVTSFDVDECHLQNILESSSHAAVLLESSIIAFDASVGSSRSDADSIHLKRILFKALKLLKTSIATENSPSLDMALRKTWAGYPGGTAWSTVSSKHDYWLVTSTPTGDEDIPLRVQYNLLTGELLVNGLPLSRLPTPYEQHPTYTKLFGKAALEILPTNMPGMAFSSKNVHHGYALFFYLSNTMNNDMLVVAKSDSKLYDLIPARVFTHALPDFFVGEYVHWYSRSSQTIEFRDKNAPWRALPESNWILRREGSGWTLERKDGQVLIGTQTESAKYFSNLLKSLEEKPHLHLILDKKSGSITIEMPRLKLDFHVEPDSTKVQSRQFRGMYIDSTARINCFVGLVSKLVLKSDLGQRKVLIPDGDPTWSWDATTNHTRVFIPPGSSHKVHLYEIDVLLQRLVDNGSLQSKLVICYLHALTSSCLPDGLTGRTGTEQALFLLRSAALRSFEYLSDWDILKLQQIAKLSPARNFYPQNLQCMESITWDKGLGYLSQDNSFHEEVQAIFSQASVTALFYPSSCAELPKLDHVNPRLGKRQSIRASSFQTYGFGAENRSTENDATYKSRDALQFSVRSERVFNIAHMLFRPQTELLDTLSSSPANTLWDFLHGTVIGPSGGMTTNDLGYDSKWLEDQRDILQRYWCQLHQLFTRPSQINLFQMLLFLSTLAYASSGDLSILQILVAIFKSNASSKNEEGSHTMALKNIEVPLASHFSLPEGRTVVRSYLENTAEQQGYDFVDCPEFNLPRNEDETDTDLHERRRNLFTTARQSAISHFANAMANQWLCETPDLADSAVYFNIRPAIATIQKKWKSWFQNHYFYEYLLKIASALKSCSVKKAPLLTKSAAAQPIWRTRNSEPYIDTDDLFSFSNLLLPCVQEDTMDLCKPLVSAVSGIKLGALLKKLNTTSSQHAYTQKYVVELEKSLEALKRRSTWSTSELDIPSMREPLVDNLQRCQDDVDGIYSALQAAICMNLQRRYGAEPTSLYGFKVLATFMAPRMSVSIVLGNLAIAPWRRLSDSWQKAIVLHGIAITKLQQATRLVRMTGPTDLIKELSNSGHSNWSPLDSPESLLLEIESGIMIREVQEKIASQMRYRPSGENAVMQLNMGEGKSSVIVPIVAAYLADGYKLVRVIVAKAQAKELFRTLTLKLGGLLNRRIYHIPFNRSLRLSSHQVRALANLYKQCREQGGVVLCQPEHLLSFKLMAVEYQTLEDRKDEGTALLDLYHYFESCARDIVDESDENFSPKFELIYTMGVQRPIELSPERWTILQRVLRIAASIVISVQRHASDSVEVTHSAPGRFPRTRILRDDAGTLLLRHLTQQICDTGLPGLPIGRQDKDMRAAIFEYVFSDKLSKDQISAVEDSSFFTEAIKGPLLIVRGLIAGRVLLFALKQKRWRVNYGLDGSRTPNTKLAVPYQAKDCPSPRSEFSHPDVVILLTCLSYYYEGLSDEELLATFDHLMRSDQADIEYQEWVKDAPELAGAFQRLGGVNIKDIGQVTEQVFPPLRYAKGTVDYFLSHLVFPKEMKEFSHKLSASGWDLGQQKRYPTTGFSGTNDSRHVLPLDVKQLDIEEQIHTNALVLENLLREENKVHLLKPSAHGASEGQNESSFIDDLFEFVADIEKQIHVILDVGAQILDLTNVQVVMRWLELLPEGHQQEAVVYFNEYGDICVIDRKGTVESLWTSPYGDQLDRCLVFLDQAHTRGTDLKLPEYYRAAVTLGPDLTKDRLVQACMRMRKLGSGQSVVFCLSQEMQFRVNRAVGNALNDGITVDDVLRWSIYETHADLHRMMPLWAIQGSRFERQKETWAKSKTPTGIRMSQDQAEEFLEEEAQTIEYRYRPTAHNAAEDLRLRFGRLRLDVEENEALAAIQSRCEDFGVSNSRSAVLQEEQEKELAPEIEQEREIQRPEPAAPEKHEIHQDLINFIRDGTMRARSPAFSSAFLALSDTSVADTSKLVQFPGSLLATADFARTVKLNTSQKKLPGARDSYQRPVQWVLTSRCTTAGMRAVIISPHEAHELIPQIMQSKAVHLHLYAPRASLVFKPLDVLKLYTTPELPANWKLPDHLRLQLNLFAGQLYFSSYEDYKSTCEMLSLAWRPPSGDVVVEADGFIPLASVETDAGNDRRATFSKSPVKSIKTLLMVLRRDCQEIDKTHWGRILAGELLTEEDLDETE